MGIFSNFTNRNKIKVVRLKDGKWVNMNSSTSFSSCDNMELALDSDVLLTCLDIFSDYASKVRFIEEDANGNEIKNSEVVNLLNNPNPYQTKEQFITQLVWFTKVYGYTYQKPYTLGGFDIPKAIYNLDTSKIDHSDQFKKSLFYKNNDIKSVKDLKFNYTDIYVITSFKYGEILPYYDLFNGIDQNPFTSRSRIDALRNRLSNLSLATEAENKIINKIGNAMIYKEKSSDAMKNAMPLGKKEQKAIEEGFDSRGVATGNGIIATNTELGYKATHIPYKDGGFKELLENNVPLVTQTMRIPNEIYKAYKEGDTFTNKAEVENNFVENVIQPFVNPLAKNISNLTNRNIKASFDHLPSMAEKKNKKIDSALKLSQAVRNLTQSGLSIEQATQYLDDLGIKTHE
jgi:hypothetical protein